jgi:hypothetical protein
MMLTAISGVVVRATERSVSLRRILRWRPCGQRPCRLQRMIRSWLVVITATGWCRASILTSTPKNRVRGGVIPGDTPNSGGSGTLLAQPPPSAWDIITELGPRSSRHDDANSSGAWDQSLTGPGGCTQAGPGVSIRSSCEQTRSHRDAFHGFDVGPALRKGAVASPWS